MIERQKKKRRIDENKCGGRDRLVHTYVCRKKKKKETETKRCVRQKKKKL